MFHALITSHQPQMITSDHTKNRTKLTNKKCKTVLHVMKRSLITQLANLLIRSSDRQLILKNLEEQLVLNHDLKFALISY